MNRALVRLAALLAFAAVALGAFGAHGLRNRVPPELIDVWKTGVLYHLIHALALLALGLAADRLRSVRLVAGLFVAGIAVFGGSLYLLTLTGVRSFGAITPVGGLCFLAGWLVLALRSTR